MNGPRVPLGRLGAWLLVACVVLPVALAPWCAPHAPDVGDEAHRLEGPSATWPAGTDELGRCVLSRTLHGGRASLALAAAVVVIAATLGGLVGAAAAGLGGLADAALTGALDLLLVVPSFVVALVAVGLAGASPAALVAVLVLAEAPTYARVARAAVGAERRQTYVLAERALGVPALRTWRRTLVPAAVAPVTTLGVLRVGRTLVTLAGLGFLGLGVPPPAAEWGGMIAAGRTCVRVAPWIVLAPGVAVVLATFAATTLASGFARAADPTLREGDT